MNRKTPGTAESRLKRRALLFAASLKKIDHDPLEENTPDTAQSKDIVDANERFIESNRNDEHKKTSGSFNRELGESQLLASNGVDITTNSSNTSNSKTIKKDDILKKINATYTENKNKEKFAGERNLEETFVMTKKANKTSPTQTSKPQQVSENKNTVKSNISNGSQVNRQLKSSHGNEDLGIHVNVEATKVTKLVESDEGSKFDESLKQAANMNSRAHESNNEQRSKDTPFNNPENDQANVQENKKKRKANDDIELKNLKKLKQGEAVGQYSMNADERWVAVSYSEP